MFRLISAVPTGRYILVAYCLAILSVIINRLGKLVPYGTDLLTAVVEWTVMGMFSMSYLMLWVLLAVGPFRPRCQFTRSGEKGKRMANLLYALAGLIVLHAFVAFKIATAVS